MTEKSSIESLMDNDMLQKRSGFTKKKKSMFLKTLLVIDNDRFL